MNKQGLNRFLRQIWKGIDLALGLLMVFIFSIGFLISGSAVLIVFPICILEMIRSFLPEFSLFVFVPVYGFIAYQSFTRWVLPFSMLPIRLIGK